MCPRASGAWSRKARQCGVERMRWAGAVEGGLVVVVALEVEVEGEVEVG